MMSNHSNWLRRAALVSCLSPAVAACGASGEPTTEETSFTEPETSEDVGATTQALATQYFRIPFNAPAGFAPAFLAGAGFVCVLAEVSKDWGAGKFSSVFVSNGQWFGIGEGAAICTRGDAFPNGGAGWTHLLSQNQTIVMDARFARNTHVPAFCGASDRGTGYACNRQLWFGDAFTFINGISGPLNGLDTPGRGDGVFVKQAANGSVSSELWGRSQNTRIEASALSFFVGVPGLGWPVRLRGYDPGGGEANGSASDFGTWQFDVSAVSGLSQFWMARSDVSFCGLTRVSGNFDARSTLNIGEAIPPGMQRKYWLLTALSANASARGAARCMLYDQR